MVMKSREAKWWQPEGKEYYDGLFETIISVCQSDSDREAKYLENISMYEGTNIKSLGDDGYHIHSDEDDSGRNVIESVLDSIYARITRAQPRPVLLADGAEAGVQKQAEDQSDAIYAALSSGGGYHEAYRAFRDAMIYDTGYVQVYSKVDDKSGQSQFVLERVYPWEIKVDYHDAYYGQPKSIFRMQRVDRSVLKQQYPDKASVIDMAQDSLSADIADSLFWSNTRDEKNVRVTDRVWVVEAWHIPYDVNDDSGVHVIAVDSGDLYVEGWSHSRAPYAIARWKEPTVGYYGKSLVDSIKGRQRTLDAHEARINRVFGTQTMPIIAVNVEDKKSADALSARNIKTITYVNQPPTRLTDPIINSQAMEWRQSLIDDVYQQSGASRLTASSDVPRGLTSGKAINNFKDTESERFAPNAKAFDDFIVQIAVLLGEEAERMVDRGYKPVSRLMKDGNKTKEFDWSNTIKTSPYTVNITVASSVEKLLSGRNTDLQEMFNLGIISPTRFLQHYDSPDIKEIAERETAPIRLVDAQIAQIKLGTGSPSVDPIFAEIALREGALELARAISEGEDPMKIDALQIYVEQARQMVHAEQQRMALIQAQAQAQTATRQGTT